LKTGRAPSRSLAEAFTRGWQQGSTPPKRRSRRYISNTINGVTYEYDLAHVGVHIGLVLLGLVLGWLIFAPHTLVFSLH
jgi:hypothetical protein